MNPSLPRQVMNTFMSIQKCDTDGYIIVTPEYNNSFPGSLKNALDFLYREWAGKSVILVGYGGGGAASARRHIHDVFDSYERGNRNKQGSRCNRCKQKTCRFIYFRRYSKSLSQLVTFSL